MSLTTRNIETGEGSQLEQLAEAITQNSQIISSFLRENSLPCPSFDPEAPLSAIPTTAPEHIANARQKLIDAAMGVFQLTTGPSEYLPHLALGYHYLSSLRWLSHFNIFSHVPITGSISYEKLSEMAAVSVVQLRTICRMAMTNKVLREPEANQVAHTSISASFVRNPMLRDWAMFMAENSATCALKMTDAAVKWPGSTSKIHTGFNVAFDTDLPVFDYYHAHPVQREEFNTYMRMVTNTDGLSLRHLLNGFHWKELGQATVVDVGGSTGNACITLAKTYEDLKFIVQDSPEVVKTAKSLMDKHPTVAERISFQGHDFFTQQPIEGADVYLLRMILHDWQTVDASKILRQLIPALKTSSSRILIMDVVLPKPGSLPATEEALFRARDMTMLQSFNSCERDLRDWEDLVTHADERFQIVNVVRPQGSLMSLIEIALREA
ncbi:hypothetical protein ACMFMG_004318 [Clarireedia jacksonii]